MNRSIACLVVGWFCLSGCNYEHYEDCRDQDDDFGFGGRAIHTGGSTARGGQTGAGGEASVEGGSEAGGATTTKGGAGGTSSGGTNSGGAPPIHCTTEAECPRGYNCDLDLLQCAPADEETCQELTSEQACTKRRDCTPVYGGINCSCGDDCECRGGEPGCICERFEFFACSDVAP